MTSIRIHHHFKPEFNHVFLSRFIMTSIRINQLFNPDLWRLQSKSILFSILIKQDSIMTSYPIRSLPQSWSNKTSIRINHYYLSWFIMNSIPINQDFNPNQSWFQFKSIKTSIRINHDFIPDLIMASILIEQDFNPDQ